MFEWKPEYSCNAEDIDLQHKKLFHLIGELYDITKEKDGFDHYDDITRIFQELSDYTVYHFGYEEKLLEQYQFDAAALKMHKLEHGAFVHKLLHVQKEDLDKNENKILMEVIMFAVEWIEKHILATDKQYSEFLNSHGVK